MTPGERADNFWVDLEWLAEHLVEPRHIARIESLKRGFAAEIRAALEERDREWVKAHHGHCNTRAWVDRKLCDPDFHAGFMRGKENDAIEDERERCAKVLEDAISEYCDRHATATPDERFCDMYGCHDLRRIAAAIREKP